MFCMICTNATKSCKASNIILRYTCKKGAIGLKKIIRTGLKKALRDREVQIKY